MYTKCVLTLSYTAKFVHNISLNGMGTKFKSNKIMTSFYKVSNAWIKENNCLVDCSKSMRLKPLTDVASKWQSVLVICCCRELKAVFKGYCSTSNIFNTMSL